MDFQRLRYFQVLSQTGHLRKSAEMLRISAPALSRAMKTLEEEIGIVLFQNDGRRLLLTDQGKLLSQKVEQLLDSVSNIRSELHEGKSPEAPYKIATFEVFSTYFLSFIDKIDWQQKRLQLHEALPGEIERHVQNGDVDIAITYMPVPHPDLDFLKIASIEMGVFTRKDSFPGVAQKELPFVVPVQPLNVMPTRLKGLDGWPEDAYKRKVQYEVTMMESALELCRQGKVAGYFPQFIVNEHNKKVRDQFLLERRRSPYGGRVCTTDVYIVKRKGNEESAMIKQIAKAIRLICN